MSVHTFTILQYVCICVTIVRAAAGHTKRFFFLGRSRLNNFKAAGRNRQRTCQGPRSAWQPTPGENQEETSESWLLHLHTKKNIKGYICQNFSRKCDPGTRYVWPGNSVKSEQKTTCLSKEKTSKP